MGLAEVLIECCKHFYHLDNANAAIHTGKVRFSPITFRLAEVIAEYYPGWQQMDAGAVTLMVGEILQHKGAYEEDKGR